MTNGNDALVWIEKHTEYIFNKWCEEKELYFGDENEDVDYFDSLEDNEEYEKFSMNCWEQSLEEE